MRKIALLLIFLQLHSLVFSQEKDFTTLFEKSGGTETPTYDEVIRYYTQLANTYDQVTMLEMGPTDSGKPLHLIIFNPDQTIDFDSIRKNKRILLINNGIHPGESDGIDATMMLFRDLAQGKITTPKHTVLVTIPIYNIGGALNRNSTTRTNQNGPLEYGFRGNARNYDLNRDFIKCDTDNARSFTGIFHTVQPDVFIDNHVSNGADYQYTLTHLFTQHNKLGGELGSYLHNELMPELEQQLAGKDWPITPYVNVFNQVPEIGFSQFMDYPRYSTGYTTLFNTFGMMVETHMLKPYKQRVEGTYELMKSMLKILEEDWSKIAQLRKQSSATYTPGTPYPLEWKVDSTRTTTLQFKGYEGSFTESSLTGAKRLKYHRDKPFIKNVTYYNYMTPTEYVEIPEAYIIPQGWHHVIELLQLNRIEMEPLDKDTIIQVASYKIDSYETRKMPYEGHYQHYNTRIRTELKEVGFRKGDLLVSTDQPGVRYLLETLEPIAPDSFFNWNFFDTILQQKEHFSPYVWEELAKELLDKNPELKATFTAKKEAEPGFANNWYAQLDWLHKQSNHYEKAHLQYPIYRVMK